MPETEQRESTDTHEGVPSVGLRRKRLARTAGSSHPPGKGRQYKKMSTLMCTHFFDGDPFDVKGELFNSSNVTVLLWPL